MNKKDKDSGNNTSQANGDGVSIIGNVTDSRIDTSTHYHQTISLPINKKIYTPPTLPNLDELPEKGDLPPGSRMPFADNVDFVGRQTDLVKIAQQFFSESKEKTKNVVLSSGIGGIGKTQLAVEFCYRYGRFFHGVHWLQADQDIELQIAECGLVMGIIPWPEELEAQVQATLRGWQEMKPRLVVLDNLESTRVFVDWLPKLTGMHILATSRRSQWSSHFGIQEFSTKELSPEESRSLLTRLSSKLEKEDPDIVDTLSERLGYHPLALYLAGSYLNQRPSFSIQDFLSELGEREKGLAHSALTTWQKELGPTGHAPNILATFDMSWDQIEDTDEDKITKEIVIAAGYCAPNIPIPLSVFYQFYNNEKNELIDKALLRLYHIGLLQSNQQSLPYIHPLIGEYLRFKTDETEILERLSNSLIINSKEALDTYLPVNMLPFYDHMEKAAVWAKANHLSTLGTLFNNIGRILSELARYEDAKQYFERALEIDTQAFGQDHPNVATDLNNLAGVLQDLDNLQDAKRYYERALEIDTQAFGQDHPNVATDLNNLAGVLRALGNLQDAKQYFERALEIDTQAFGQDHPKVAIRLNNLALVLQDLGNLQDAKQYFERALEIDTQAFGQDHPQVATKLNNLAGVLRDLGNLQDAKQHFERALEIDTQAFGQDHPQVATKLNNLAGVLRALGNLDDAKQYYERALEIDTQAFGQDHPQVATDLNNLASVLQDLGNLEDAKHHYEHALKIFQCYLPEGHQNIQTVQQNLELVRTEIDNRKE